MEGRDSKLPREHNPGSMMRPKRGLGTARTGDSKSVDMRLRNRKTSFTFSERMNSWALVVALIGEGYDRYCSCQILDFLVNIPAVSNADNKNHKFFGGEYRV